MPFLKFSLRFWIPGIMCLICGIATRIALSAIGHWSRLDMAREMVFQFFWYSLGLIFLRIDMYRRWEELHAKNRDSLYRVLWWTAFVGSIVAIWSSCPP